MASEEELGQRTGQQSVTEKKIRISRWRLFMYVLKITDNRLTKQTCNGVQLTTEEWADRRSLGSEQFNAM